jgi:chloramphenicol O-acetyltransferase type A
MRTIDLQTWPRRQHYEIYRRFDHPHFSLCANVDLGAFYSLVKERGFSISAAIIYLISRVANEIPEFRYRMRGEQVVEHAIVHPSTTLLNGDDLFSFCTIQYSEDFSEFVTRAARQMAYVREHPTLSDEPGRDDMLFMTAIPWVSFTSFTHPTHLNPADSVPRFAWGKFFEEGGALKMPLGVQVHHALMDGVHVGRYYEKIQDYLYHPEILLDKGKPHIPIQHPPDP